MMACRNLVKEFRAISPAGARLFSSVTSKDQNDGETRTDITKVTHTGQVFDENDYRNARFVNAKRYVNDNWAIKLIDEIPPLECKDRVVCCDGGNPQLGHPKVYINLDKPGNHACGYCGLRYVLKTGHH